MELKKSAVLLEMIRRLSRRDAQAHITRILLKSHPSEIAAVIRQLPEDEGVEIISYLRGSKVEAETFQELGGAFIETYLSVHNHGATEKKNLAEVLQRLPEDEIANLLGGLPEDEAREIMSLMQAPTQQEVVEILEYEEGTCGRIMAVNVFSLNQKLTARDAIAVIQRADTTESLFYIYVVDDYENLMGVISLRQLLQGVQDKQLKDFMKRDVIRVNVYQSQQEAATLIEEYNFVCLPVVDEEGKLKGMMTVDDIIDFLRDEAQEEVMQLAGVDKHDIEDFSFLQGLGARALWYILLILGGVLSSESILFFFPGFPSHIALLCFTPLVMRLGGSIATQTATFVCQSLMNQDIERARALRAFWGQNLVTAVMGVLLALCVYAYLWLRFDNNLWMALRIAVGVVAVTMVSLVVGLLVPWVAGKIRIDAQKVSSRFVHFLMDPLTLVVFFAVFWFWPLE